MKNPKNAESWKNIDSLSDAEKSVVEKILDMYASTVETEPELPTATLKTVAVVKLEDEQECNALALALAIKGHDYTKGLNNCVTIKMDQTIEFDSMEEFEEMSESRAKEIAEDWTLEDIYTCTDFCGITPKNITVSADELTTEGGSDGADLDMVFSFNAGRVNAEVSGAKDEFIENYGPCDAEIKAYELGEFVTKVQKLEQSGIGQIFNNLFKNFNLNALIDLF